MDNDKNQKAQYSRFLWTWDLHDKFIDAVNQLGGPEKATPKGLLRIMEIPELNLNHLRTHLQIYRMAKSKRFVGNKQEDETCKSRSNRILVLRSTIGSPEEASRTNLSAEEDSSEDEGTKEIIKFSVN